MTGCAQEALKSVSQSDFDLVAFAQASIPGPLEHREEHEDFAVMVGHDAPAMGV
ncbi:MAG TPA: hypothetical protein VF942_07445 [Acidimicrobiales bacterium]